MTGERFIARGTLQPADAGNFAPAVSGAHLAAQITTPDKFAGLWTDAPVGHRVASGLNKQKAPWRNTHSRLFLPYLNPHKWVAALGAGEGNEALVSIGVTGHISLSFIREADTAEAALLSALKDVSGSIPGAIG